MLPSASLMVNLGFAAVTATVVILWLLGVWRWARPSLGVVVVGTLAWLGLFAALALSGILQRFDARPPPIAGVMLSVLLMGITLGRSKILDAIPTAALVLFNGFRLPLELFMHAAAREGTMPSEMSFSGYNFDIVSGASAILIGLALWRGAPVWLAKVWAVLGLALLLIVVAVALAATPTVHAFGPVPHLNTFIAYVPFVYLPTVSVLAALASHIALLRRLF